MNRRSLTATYLFQIHKGAIYMLRNHSLSGKNSGLENPFNYKVWQTQSACKGRR